MYNEPMEWLEELGVYEDFEENMDATFDNTLYPVLNLKWSFQKPDIPYTMIYLSSQ